MFAISAQMEPDWWVNMMLNAIIRHAVGHTFVSSHPCPAEFFPFPLMARERRLSHTQSQIPMVGSSAAGDEEL
jgi:hypothetical protein